MRQDHKVRRRREGRYYLSGILKVRESDRFSMEKISHLKILKLESSSNCQNDWFCFLVSFIS